MAATDLTDAQWARIEPLLPPANKIGRPRRSTRQIIDGIRLVLATSTSWRDIPRDTYGPWQTVYHRYNAWRKDGTWDAIERAVRGAPVGPQDAPNRETDTVEV